MTYEDVPCAVLVELVTDYLEGVLSTEQRLAVEWHLSFCEPCVIYLDQMRAVLGTVGELREDDVPEPVMRSLLDAFRDLEDGLPRPIGEG